MKEGQESKDSSPGFHPISVLYFSNESVRAGAEEHMLTLLRGLDRRYFRLHLVCPPLCAEKLRPDLPEDVELLPLCLSKPRHIRAALRLAQILLQHSVDILHSHLSYASLFASPIGRLCRVPVIIETPHLREAWRHGWLKGGFVIDRFLGRSVSYYIAVSEANARYLADQKGLPQEKIVVIHNGCALDRFNPQQPGSRDLKRNLGFDESDPVLLAVARLEPQKGHSILLKALLAVRREFPRVRLVCLGEGSLRADLEGAARALSLGESVRFVGYQSNVGDWLALADITVLPSFFEGLPLVAIESLAAGKPMVATAVDGTPEVVVDGKTGLTVPPGDASRLGDAICQLLREPALRQALGRAGREWVLEHFSREEQIRRTQEFYLRAWAESRVRRKRVSYRDTEARRGTEEVDSQRLTVESERAGS
jgi:glycosyltransferase involved in cell wall biosynthesis